MPEINKSSIFDNFDFAFLGDIHKTNQILDEEGKVRYPGSLVQQNFGESNDKGYLVWDIENKDEYYNSSIDLHNFSSSLVLLIKLFLLLKDIDNNFINNFIKSGG